MTDPLGHTTTTTYDALNRKVTVTQASPNGTSAAPVTTYAYDPAGNLLSVTDAKGYTTTYGYDALNRQLTDTNLSAGVGGTRTEAYDAAGNLLSTVDRNGRKITYGYDNLNRKITENWLNSSSTIISTITSTYDLAGRLATSGDANSTTSYTYDNLNRVVSETTVRATLPGEPLVVNYTYDAAGNRQTMSLLTGTTNDLSETSNYDALNRMLNKTQSGVTGGVSRRGLNTASVGRVKSSQ